MKEDFKNILFLDVDGNLAGEEYFARARDRKGDALFIDPEKVKLLNELKNIPNITIVISSSWGQSADGPLQRLGLEIPISGHIHHFHEDWICRGSEIEHYLVSTLGEGTKYGEEYRNKELYNYVIIDDDEDMLLGQKDHFVHVRRETGLTRENINQIKNILI